mgnify:FL=1
MTPGKPATGQQQAAPAIPGCVPGDEVYLHHPNGPVIARIVAHGEHGITADVKGRQHKVKWDKVLGHRRRAAVDMHVEDEGEDGMVVRDQHGKRHYVAIPPEAREENMVVKSLGGQARALFLKGMAPRAGLTEKKITDKNGVQTTRWVSNTGAPASVGHHVAFQNGEHTGHGQVKAVGKDGVTVHDPSGGEHRVTHDKLTHRWEGEGTPTEGPAAPAPGEHPEVVGTREFAGMPINIERKAGSVRTKTPRSGGPTWSMTMQNDYGEIPGTKASDGDPIDVYMGPNDNSQKVFVVNQVKKDGATFDEHKVMLGFDDQKTASDAYLAHYPAGWKGMQSVTPMSVAQFKQWSKGEIKGEPAVAPKVDVAAHEGDADSFSAHDFAQQHDDPNASPESIVAGFGGDAAAKIQAARERLGDIKPTDQVHAKAGVWIEERAALHRKLMFDGTEVNGKKVPGLLSPDRIKAATPPPGQQPTFIALGGRGGSGKSSLNGRVYEEARAIVLDADHIKGMLPEYQGWNTHQLHDESSHVLETVLAMAKILGVNVVLDATMKTGKSIEAKVDDFKASGFRVEAHYMHLPRQEAAKRAVGRYLRGGEKGRFVPPEVVMGNTQNEANFDAIKAKSDAWSFHDNSGEKDAGPKMIASKGKPATVAERVLSKSAKPAILFLSKRK